MVARYAKLAGFLNLAGFWEPELPGPMLHGERSMELPSGSMHQICVTFTSQFPAEMMTIDILHSLAWCPKIHVKISCNLFVL